jgi:dGTPase
MSVLSTAEREAALLAPYAMRSDRSAGRKHPEPSHAYRAPFARDRDRIIHSAAYRRLSYKTQVFTGELGDYHRSRLTHTLEVSLIARTLGRALRLNEDLVEALAVAHDIGHPPFGHSGEETLDACLRDVGGFSHNAQALRIVEQLERRYPTFPGLNLSLEVLEGQAARAEKGTVPSCSATGEAPVPATIGDSPRRPLLETQVVDAADSIAYDTHDADDAMELGLLQLADLLEVSLWSEAARRVHGQYTGLAGGELRRAVLHELIDWQAGDLLAQTQTALAEAQIDSVEAVRRAPTLVRHSPELAALKTELESLLADRVYRHPQVLEMRGRVQAQLEEMFRGYLNRPELLPEGFRTRAAAAGLPRTVGDYLAGMTDRFALREHARLFEA